jgi:transposase
MKPLQLSAAPPEQLQTLEQAYRTTRDARLRTRVQMILLALEHGWTERQMAAIVRESDETVRRWLKRYAAEGLLGLHDAPRSGARASARP